MRRPVPIVLALALSACGLTDVYTVKSERGSGIPFFPLEAVDTTTAVYEQRWYELELTTTWKDAAAAPAGKGAGAGEDAPKPGTFTTTVVRFATSLEAARNVTSAFGLSPSPKDAYESASRRFREDGKLTVAEPAAPTSFQEITALPLARLERRRDHVAAAAPLYLNSTVPFGGKNDASFELSEKGTLSKVSADVSDDLPATVATFLGTALGTEVAKVAVSKAIGVAAEAKDAAPRAISDVSLTLTPVRRTFLLTVVRAAGDTAACDAGPLLRDPLAASASCRASLAVEVVRGAPAEESGPAREDGKKKAEGGGRGITFSGSVQLPPAEGAGKKSDAGK